MFCNQQLFQLFRQEYLEGFKFQIKIVVDPCSRLIRSRDFEVSLQSKEQLFESFLLILPHIIAESPLTATSIACSCPPWLTVATRRHAGSPRGAALRARAFPALRDSVTPHSAFPALRCSCSAPFGGTAQRVPCSVLLLLCPFRCSSCSAPFCQASMPAAALTPTALPAQGKIALPRQPPPLGRQRRPRRLH